jgi:hypothetical protein
MSISIETQVSVLHPGYVDHSRLCQVVVFWVLTPSSLVVCYQFFGELITSILRADFVLLNILQTRDSVEHNCIVMLVNDRSPLRITFHALMDSSIERNIQRMQCIYYLSLYMLVVVHVCHIA